MLSLVSILLCVFSTKIGWKTPNIVSEKGKWVQVALENPGGPAFNPFPPHDKKHLDPKAKLVILVAALRETRCADTLHNLWSKAKHPSRIFFVVVQQNLPEDPDCLEALCLKLGKPLIRVVHPKTDEGEKEETWTNPNQCPVFDQVRMKRLHASQAKGPVYARALSAQLVEEDDDFCAQIDAHTDAVPDWDVLMLEMWGDTRNEYAVLTTYPTNIKDLGENTNKHWEMPHLCQASYNAPGVLNNGQASAAANLERPVLSPLWAAGLSLSKCHAERNVPNDVNLKSIFTGEEFARGIRLWTHGYDFYSPTRPWVGTFYGGEKGNKGSFPTSAEEVRTSHARMATLTRWGGHADPALVTALGFYDLGTRRTLEQYANFSGINTLTGKVDVKCTNGWTPWVRPETVYSEYKNTQSATPLSKSNSEVQLLDLAGYGLGLGFVSSLVLLGLWARRWRRVLKPTHSKYAV